MTKRTALLSGFALLALAAGLVYYHFDPASAGIFPPCPVHYVTGFLCAGCGAQRAIHALLHGDIGAAWAFNPLLILALPYALVGTVAEWRAPRSWFWACFRKTGYGQVAIWTTFTVIIFFTIGRNL